MAKGWRKQVLATGKQRTSDGHDYTTFEEFCEAQRVRVSIAPLSDRALSLIEDSNDDMLLAAVLHETTVEVRR